MCVCGLELKKVTQNNELALSLSIGTTNNGLVTTGDVFSYRIEQLKVIPGDTGIRLPKPSFSELSRVRFYDLTTTRSVLLQHRSLTAVVAHFFLISF